MEIVNTNINYTYEIMINDINKLKKRYEFIENGSIGYSVLGKNMPYIKIGRGVKEVLYTAAFHANEWITSVLLMKFVEDFCIAYETNSNIYGYNARQIFGMTSIYLVPMVNPDGVDLLTGAVPRDSGVYINIQSLANNYPQIPFPSGWKANFNGVDLKNFQHFYMYCKYSDYKGLYFSFKISSILMNLSKFSVIEFNFEKLKYMYTFLSLSISILFINLYKNILSIFSNFKKFSINLSKFSFFSSHFLVSIVSCLVIIFFSNSCFC